MLIPLESLEVKPCSVLHVGAHLAEEAEAYSENGFLPVWWCEANPMLMDKLWEAVMPYPENVAVNACLSSEIGRTTLHIASNGQSSSLLELGTHKVEHPDVTYVRDIHVNTTTIDTLFDDGVIGQAEFMNLDIQGAELLALKGAERYLDDVQTIYTEVNAKELYKGCVLFEELAEWLGVRRFRLVTVKWTAHGWGDAVFAR